MKAIVFVALVACGGKQNAGTGNGSGAGSDPPPPLQDTRTEIEKRRDAACDPVGDKLNQCAVDEAKADVAAGKVSQKDFELNTAPNILEENKRRWLKVCRTPKTSFQVRVLEVCLKEETECGPFLDCLSHLNDKPKEPAK